jgi:hypothetical protein
MTQSMAIKEILEEISLTILNLQGREILGSGDAFEIAQRIAEEAVSRTTSGLDAIEKRRAVREILHEASHPAREIVAQQFVGTTLEEIIETTKNARSRFQGKDELEITAKPTLNYTGDCEPLEPWNLYSNAVHAFMAAEAAKAKGDWTPTDEALLIEVKRAKQMLHFLCQHEINADDITGKPFDGKITHQTRPMRLS